MTCGYRCAADLSFARVARVAVCLWALLRVGVVLAETLPSRGLVDSRVRVVTYNSEEVYRLHGYVGYEIDLQFELGESFVGLGAGDLDGVSFVAQDNHLFIKPKAARVNTNMTVLTTRRPYQIDYTATIPRPGAIRADAIYSLRFIYPPVVGPGSALPVDDLGRLLEQSSAGRPRNVDYWYCGNPAVKPIEASDDGVHTRIRFGARSEQPALFVRNDDGTESLLNFSMDGGDVVVHRVVRKLIVRRGKLTGCIVNKGFSGQAGRLESGTVSPGVERRTGQAADPTRPGSRP